MSLNPNKYPSQSSKFKLISQFVEQSSCFKKDFQNRHQFISEVRTSREVITVEPDNHQTCKNGIYDSTAHEKQLFTKFEQKPFTNSFNLRESFVKAQMDQTTYESLMHQFMGSYIQERLSSKLPKQQTYNNYQNSHKESRIVEIPYFKDPLVDKDYESPINKESQITFSGSKQSRIINETEESRVVKEEYFLLDQLKNSQKSKKSSYTEPKSLFRQENLFDKNKYFIEQSYKLRAPSSPQKLKQSGTKIRQSLEKKSLRSSNEKTKIQKINLQHEAAIKSGMKSAIKQQYQKKYNISKQGSTVKKSNQKEEKRFSPLKVNHLSHSRSQHKEQPIVVHVTLVKEQEKEISKPTIIKSPQKRRNQDSLSKSSKKMDISNYLKTNKTFNSSSKLKKYPQDHSIEIEQPSSKKTNLDNQKKFVIAKEKSTKREPNIKQKPQTMVEKTFSNSKKYNYEHNYNMNNTQLPLQKNSILSTHRDMSFHAHQTSRTQQYSRSFANDEQADIHKDRQMISQIKKDLTKLIHKISSTPIKLYHR